MQHLALAAPLDPDMLYTSIAPKFGPEVAPQPTKKGWGSCLSFTAVL